MADKSIGSLTKVTSLQNGDAFVIERSSAAVQTDAETIKEYVLSGVSGNVVINGNLSTMTADKTSSDVLDAIQAGNSIEMHLHGSNETEYRSAEFVKIEYSAENEEFIAYFVKHSDTAGGGMKSVMFTLGDDGRISGDSDIGVNSVNGLTGDVQLPTGVSSVNGQIGRAHV